MDSVHKGLTLKKDFQCKECDKAFNRPSLLKNHLINVHEGEFIESDYPNIKWNPEPIFKIEPDSDSDSDYQA